MIPQGSVSAPGDSLFWVDGCGLGWMGVRMGMIEPPDLHISLPSLPFRQTIPDLGFRRSYPFSRRLPRFRGNPRTRALTAPSGIQLVFIIRNFSMYSHHHLPLPTRLQELWVASFCAWHMYNRFLTSVHIFRL